MYNVMYKISKHIMFSLFYCRIHAFLFSDFIYFFSFRNVSFCYFWFEIIDRFPLIILFKYFQGKICFEQRNVFFVFRCSKNFTSGLILNGRIGTEYSKNHAVYCLERSCLEVQKKSPKTRMPNQFHLDFPKMIANAKSRQPCT